MPPTDSYYTKEQLELRHHIASKGVGAKLALSDGAQVLLAEFVDDTALHVNCADATPVAIDRLHMALTREFVGNQHQLVGNICRVAFEWPSEDDRVMTYDPTRPGWTNQGKPSALVDVLGWVVAVAVVGGLGAFVFWKMGAFGR